MTSVGQSGAYGLSTGMAIFEGTLLRFSIGSNPVLKSPLNVLACIVVGSAMV